MSVTERRILLWVLVGMIAVTMALMAFNVFATMELADEAAELKEALLASG